MNILIFSQASWDDKNSAGNTFSNLFSGWSEDTFFHFFTRKNLPGNDIADEYYCQSITDVFKHPFAAGRKGIRFSKGDLQRISFPRTEQDIIDTLHKHKKREIIYWMYEWMWRSRIWLNRDVKSFIQEAQPDIFFAFATSTYILKDLFAYMDQHTEAKKVLYIVDDVYTGIQNAAFYRRPYLKRYLKKVMCQADIVYGISPEMCASYRNRYHREVKLLYKGCNFVAVSGKPYRQPLRFVYAGNLSYGRDAVLRELAQVLHRINQNGVKAILEIYTTAPYQSELDIADASVFMGAKPYDEIKEILKDADVTLHVESFEERHISQVRYSVSTKIMDCLQSGRTVMAIGPAGISSIEFVRKIPGTFIIDRREQMEQSIREMMDKIPELHQYAESTGRYVNRNFHINILHTRLRSDFEEITRR